MSRYIVWFKKNKTTVLIAVFLLLIALSVRVTDLGVFLTADEKNWIGRSYEFIKAFKDWRFNEMLQTTHPGVTTLWISGFAVTAKIIMSHVPFSFHDLVYFVKISQLSIAVANSLMVPVIYLLLSAMFKKNKFIAVASGLLIALSPFIVGYSRVVHVDALLGSLLFAAAVATVLYGRSGFSRKWLIVSVLFSGLAILTKAPAIFMLPYFVLVVLVYGWGSLRKKEFLVLRAREFVIWLLLIGIMIIIIWPAMLWVPNPEGNVLVLKRDIGRAAITPHHMAQGYTLNGGYYIFTLLTRTTPIVFLLMVVGIAGMLRDTIRYRKENRQMELLIKDKDEQSVPVTGSYGRDVWLLVSYVFFFVVMMMLGAKKGDRYILPVFFAVNVLAAVGIWQVGVGLVRLVVKVSGKAVVSAKQGANAVLALVVLSLGIILWQYHPYAIAYSNPFLPDNLSQELGWGEGLEQVGLWLNENDPDAVVASWYPEELGVYTSAHVAHINAHEQGKVKYIVLYRNMFGRALDHYANNFIDEYYKKREPVYVVSIVGKEFAWVYEKRVYGNVLGELALGREVKQLIDVKNTDLVGIELMAATYSGEAKEGDLVVDFVDVNTGKSIQRWKRAVLELEDKGWTRFLLDELIGKGEYLVIITAEHTGGKAPTIRYSREGGYRKSKMQINGKEKNGDIAVRLLYAVRGQITKEEDEKLLTNN